jgi:DNA-binding transcriptional regulator YhcF (GntR family)
MNNLSLADNQILGLLFIEAYYEKNQKAPSVMDMATECNMTYNQAKHVRTILKRKGMISSESGVGRSMRYTEYGFGVVMALHDQEIVNADDIVAARERIGVA